MNRSILSEPSAVDGCPRCLAIKIDGPNRGYHNVRNMHPLHPPNRWVFAR